LEISEGYSIPAKNEDNMMRKAPMSPMSPVKAAVTNVWTNQPREAVVHRARLRNFNEGTQETDAPRSLNLPLRKIKSTISIGDESTSAGSEAPEVRNLGSQEVVRRNRDAVDWFRNSRSVNRKVRSIEDTETLLAQARERRDNGADLITREAAKEIPLGKAFEAKQKEMPKAALTLAKAFGAKLAETPKAEQKEVNDTEQKVVATAQPEVRARRILDPKTMYAAKPKEEPKKVEVAENAPRTSCMRGDVTTGVVGPGGLLARLRLKAAANKVMKANQAIKAMQKGLPKRRTSIN